MSKPSDLFPAAYFVAYPERLLRLCQDESWRE